MTTEKIVATLQLPDHFQGTPEQKRAVTALANARLPFEVEARWRTTVHPFTVDFVRVAQCPRVVPLASVRDKIDACKPGEILIGLDRSKKPYYGSFLTDDPHWGFEVGSRRGKSTFLSLTAAQILHQDPRAECTGIDVKRESFKALFGVPRLHLHNDPRDIQGMWAAIRRVREIMDQRCDDRGADPTLEFPFHLLLIDEVSQFSAQSAQLWRQVKEKGDPAHPPVWDDIAAIMWQGAAFRMHVLLAGQRIDHQITGGIGLITSLGFRGLAGFRRQNWMRLIGTFPVPRSRPERGRWIYSDGESETWVQNIWADDEEVKALAMSTSHDGAGEAVDAGSTEPRGTWEVTPESAGETVENGTVWITGNADAAAHLGIHIETFRKRRKAREIPNTQRSGKSPTWTTQDLNEWGATWEQETVELPAEVA